MNVSKGFTLAEVLITLGIIGIVAAMTLPALIANHRNLELQTRFKKAYSTLWNIHMRMVGDYNGVYSNFIIADVYSDAEGVNKKRDYITKFILYVNGGKVCNYQNSYLSCTGKSLPAKYLTYDGKREAHLNGDVVTDQAVLTSDGMSFFFGSPTYRNARLYVDTNGTAKGPNRLGFDLFAFDIDKNDKIVFPKNVGGGSSAGNDEGTFQAVNLCSIKKNSDYNGFGCSEFALIDKSPDNPNVSYWKNLPK